MFYYDKDPDRMMNAKKREIIEELHAEKARILQELSGVDKITLTRLRELITNYSRIERDLNTQYNKINSIIESNSNALERFADALTKIDKLETKPEKHHNTDGLINKMFEVCNTYTNKFDSLVYGNSFTAYDPNCNPVSGKHEVDCSSFINLLIRGVTFENSRYNGNSTNIVDSKFFNEFDGYENRVSNKIAQWLELNGYTFTPAADFSNLEAGDLLFFKWDNMDGIGDEFHDTAYKNIDHVCMYLNQKNDNIFLTIQYVDTNPNFLYPVNAEYMRQCVLAARLPFRHFNTPIHRIKMPPAGFNEEGAMSSNGGDLITLNLDFPMVAGKIYSVFFRGEFNTENSYPVIQGITENSRVTLHTSYGETWTGEQKNYKCYFICPDTLSDYEKIVIAVGAPSGATNSTASIEDVRIYEGYLSDKPY